MNTQSGNAFQSNVTDGLMFTLASAFFLVVALWLPVAYDVPIVSSNLPAVIKDFSLGDMTIFVGSLAAQLISAVLALFAGIQALTLSGRYKKDLVSSRGWLVGFFVAMPPLMGFVISASLICCAARIVFTLYGFGKL
ncbi:hypothetical protein [Idiomarina sp. UBA1919]|uniref:hypothetical protein n=1 Tax=Idiomarina sp. UBA1919 TaxID=1946640 RepID=UPI00257E29B2|nr:hypothetical protein [Idiomarina sp. UBA1919]|tara:strand:+ start:407 stop:817 length:411 start_codon:yes stop_codon:yes gene_type:complete